MQPIHSPGGRPRRPRPAPGGPVAAAVLAVWLGVAGACTRDERAEKPSALVEILARAASTGRLDTLATLCDPSRQNDGFTRRICEVPRRPGDREEFSTFFRDARPGMWTSEDTAEGSRGMVLATVASGRAVRFGTVRRRGSWYLEDMRPVGTIEIGDTIDGRVTDRAPEAWFVFHAAASGEYRIQMRSQWPVEFRLYAASGEPLITVRTSFPPPASMPGEAEWREGFNQLQELEAAPYWLRVAGESREGGRFRLQVKPA
jgi:hypothetical protein